MCDQRGNMNKFILQIDRKIRYVTGNLSKLKHKSLSHDLLQSNNNSDALEASCPFGETAYFDQHEQKNSSIYKQRIFFINDDFAKRVSNF